jgi:hypothetical protein
VVECLGISATLPYVLLLVVSTRPTGSPGLPPGNSTTAATKWFNVHVLVPCLNESREVRSCACHHGLL